MAMKDLKAVPEELTFIVSDPKGWELGFVRDVDSIDLDLGDTNDFELQIDASIWSPERYSWRNRLYIPGTEYGADCWKSSRRPQRITASLGGGIPGADARSEADLSAGGQTISRYREDAPIQS